MRMKLVPTLIGLLSKLNKLIYAKLIKQCSTKHSFIIFILEIISATVPSKFPISCP